MKPPEASAHAHGFVVLHKFYIDTILLQHRLTEIFKEIPAFIPKYLGLKDEQSCDWGFYDFQSDEICAAKEEKIGLI